MKLFEKLDEDNFHLFAAHYYNNKQCTSVEEFNEDLNRFKYIKRLLSRYKNNNELQERLLINHIIILYNTFGIEAANKMMWFKIDEDQWSVIKTVLVYLNFLPENEKIEVPLDEFVVERLRKI